MGYFQRLTKEIDIDKVKEKGYGMVRRQTGGRGVLHDKELTYSVIVPESHPEMPSTITEAYRVISEGLLQGYKELGLDAYFAIPRSKEERDKLKQPRSAVCFDAPSWYELVVEGRKIAGSAQVRQKGLSSNTVHCFKMLMWMTCLICLYLKRTFKRKMKKAFLDKAVALNDISDKKITIAEMEVAFEKDLKRFKC